MTTYSLSGSFGWAGGGKSGAIVDLWATSRFAGFPVQNQAPPPGNPDAGPVTTGADFGNPGAYFITGITVLQDYYIRIQYGGDTYWGERTAASLGGATIPFSFSSYVNSGVVTAAETTTSSGYSDLATPGPIVTATTGASVVAWINLGTFQATTGDTNSAGVAVSGATTVTAPAGQPGALVLQPPTAIIQVGIATLITGLTPGVNTFTLKYGTNNGHTATFIDRVLIILT